MTKCCKNITLNKNVSHETCQFRMILNSIQPVIHIKKVLILLYNLKNVIKSMVYLIKSNALKYIKKPLFYAIYLKNITNMQYLIDAYLNISSMRINDLFKIIYKK